MNPIDHNSIDNASIKALITSRLNGADIRVEGDGYHYYVTVVSEQFAGKSTLQRHKMIYAALNEVITSGALHALALKTYTPAEHSTQSSESNNKIE